MNNVIDFHAEVERRRAGCDGNETRRAPDQVENSGYHRYVLELEHEILELKEQVCALHRDLVRARG